jgi:hypothetical protein
MYVVSKTIRGGNAVAKKKCEKEAWRNGFEKMLDEIGYTQEVEDTIAEFRAAEQADTNHRIGSAKAKRSDPIGMGSELNSLGLEHGELEEWLEREGIQMILNLLQTDAEFRKKVASLASKQS